MSYDFTSFPQLTTERLILRQLTHADAGAIMAIYSAPETLRYLNLEPTDTLEKAVGMIDWLNGQYVNQQEAQWAITLRENGQVIGNCGTASWDRSNRHIDIGYHIAPALWGQGYATEAADSMIRWCFDCLDVHRIQADCTDGNIGSERVLLKCGFKVEGLWRESCWEHERFVDIKQFGLLRRDFESGQDERLN
jgi:[ribosomal protein S5]-alanine N-acetyltransferase